MNEKTCHVCDGTKPKPFPNRCEKHDICEDCGTNRSELKEIPWGTRAGFRCQPCETAKIQKKIADFQAEEHRPYDFEYNHNIKCPYCGYEYDPEHPEECDGEIECGDCGNAILVEVHYEITYSTSKEDQARVKE